MSSELEKMFAAAIVDAAMRNASVVKLLLKGDRFLAACQLAIQLDTIPFPEIEAALSKIEFTTEP